MDTSPAVLIRSYAIELTIQSVALVALLGGAITLRRRGMADLALSWGLFTLTSLVTLAALLAVGTSFAAAGSVLLAVTFTATTAAQLLQRRLAITLGTHVSARSLAADTARFLGIGAALSLLLIVLLRREDGNPALALTVGRVVSVGVGLSIVVAVWRNLRRPEAQRAVLILLGVNAAAGTLRILLRALIDVDTRRVTPLLPADAPLIVSVAQQSVAVITFIAMLVLLERDAMRQQIDNLRRAELELAASRRLESLGKMASSIAHDFNTVLTILMHGLDEAEEADAESRAAGIRDARSAAERGRLLTTRLLDFARDRPRTPALFDPSRRVMTNADVWRHMVRAPATITVRSAPDVPMLLMDPVQFDQLLLNLIGNAADAIDERGTISVVCEPVTLEFAQEVLGGTLPPGSYCRLSVQDDGMGMSPDTIRMAFEPFFTTKGSGGTGLGLATVLAIATSVGGGIIVQSVPNAGATFTVLLPAARRASRDN